MRKWLLCWVVVVCAACPARAAEPYVVTGVKVDVTADNATDARDQAMVLAQRNAFNALAAQVLPGAPAPRVSTQQLGEMVDDIRVEQEQFSANRYVASFTVRLRQIPVRSAFDGHEIPGPQELTAQQPQPNAAAGTSPPPAPVAVIAPILPPVAETTPPIGPPKTMLVQIPAALPPSIADQIRGAPGVTNTELRSQSADRSILLVTYQGDTYQMLQTLAARGVNLQVVAPTQPPVYAVTP